MIPILYGLDWRWVRTSWTPGRLALVCPTGASTFEGPEIAKTKALPAFPRWQQRTLKSRAIENFLWHQQRPATATATIDG